MDGLTVGLLVPVVGTTLGASFVYALKDRIPAKINNIFMGFTAGVMIAAAVWSLLIPSMEMTGGDGLAAVMPAVGGSVLGVVFLLAMDYAVPHQHGADSSSEGPRSKMSRTWKLVLAIILHNIPEGMAIGVAFAAVMEGSSYLSIRGTITDASHIVNSAATGCTTPLRKPIPKALFLEFPASRKGNDTIAPSGTFCMDMPMDKASAPATDRYELPLCLCCLRLPPVQ